MFITLFKIKNSDEVQDFADSRNYYQRVGCDALIVKINDETFDILQQKHKEKKVKFKDNKLVFE